MQFNALAARTGIDAGYFGNGFHHFIERLDEKSRSFVGYDFRQGAPAEAYDRRTAGHGFHRNQRAGFINQAGYQHSSRIANQFQLPLQADAAYQLGSTLHSLKPRHNLLLKVILVTGEGIHLACQHDGHSGQARSIERKMWAFLRADTSEPEQIIGFAITKRKTIHIDAVAHYASKLGHITEASRLRL